MLLPIPASGPNRGPNPPSKLESGYRRIPTARPVKPIIVIAPLIRNIHQYGLLFFILSLLVQRHGSADGAPCATYAATDCWSLFILEGQAVPILAG
jgi:hypothetical protein